MVLGITDESLTGDEYMDLYIFTFDDNPRVLFHKKQDIFPDFDPYNLKINEENNKKFQELLKNLVDGNRIAEFIVEPLIDNDKVIFRIVDTKFKK